MMSKVLIPLITGLTQFFIKSTSQCHQNSTIYHYKYITSSYNNDVPGVARVGFHWDMCAVKERWSLKRPDRNTNQVRILVHINL